jgi:hypothetical protein
MNSKVCYSTPMLHVRSIEESIRWYELLGFRTIDTDRCTPIGWARLHCEGGAVMFLRAEEPVDASQQAVLLYMYTPDLAALRSRLQSSGVRLSEISYPEYMPSGEMRLSDPDGYAVLVAHWGEKERRAWEKRIEAIS